MPILVDLASYQQINNKKDLMFVSSSGDEIRGVQKHKQPISLVCIYTYIEQLCSKCVCVYVDAGSVYHIAVTQFLFVCADVIIFVDIHAYCICVFGFISCSSYRRLLKLISDIILFIM
jgi:hypothetical protein